MSEKNHEEPYQTFIRRAGLALALVRVETGLGRPLLPAEIEMCMVEAALLHKKATEQEIFTSEESLLERWKDLHAEIDLLNT